MMRWQGTTIGRGLWRSACATARTAAGRPSSRAIPAYDATAPYGTATVACITCALEVAARRAEIERPVQTRAPTVDELVQLAMERSSSAPSSSASTPASRNSREAGGAAPAEILDQRHALLGERAMRIGPSGDGATR